MVFLATDLTVPQQFTDEGTVAAGGSKTLTLQVSVVYTLRFSLTGTGPSVFDYQRTVTSSGANQSVSIP